jgi:hypothetical protein
LAAIVKAIMMRMRLFFPKRKTSSVSDDANISLGFDYLLNTNCQGQSMKNFGLIFYEETNY